MRIKSKLFDKVKTLSSRFGKRFWLPAALILATVAGLGTWAIVRAITNIGDGTSISRKANSHSIYYGVIPENTNQSWNTNWYTVTNTTQGTSHDAMCMQAIRHQPGGTGVAYANDEDIKNVMLATVPSYSAAATTDYYTNFSNWFSQNYTNGAYSGWQAAMRTIRNLAQNDTGVVYDGGDSGISDTDRIFAIGHMLVSGIYDAPNAPDNYYALNAADIASLNTIKGYIDQYFNSLPTNPADEYEAYRTWVNAETQTVGWLEYKGVPATTAYTFKLRKVDSADYTHGLAGASFWVCEVDEYNTDANCAYVTTDANGDTPLITTATQQIRWHEVNFPAGYVCSSPRTTAGAYGSTCWNQETVSNGDVIYVANTSAPTAYIKIKKLSAENSQVSYAGLTVAGTTFSVKNNGVEVTTITISADGTGITASALPVGTYTISEKFQTSGYLQNTATLTVTLDASNTATTPATVDMTTSSTACSSGASPCTFYNDVIKGAISLTKLGETLSGDKPLAGVTFTATHQSDPSITYTIGPTDTNGVATSPNMVYGTYNIVEQRSSANAAYGMISFTATISSANTSTNNLSFSTGSNALTNELSDDPSLSTVARNSNSTFANPDKELEISATAGVTDRITCYGLESGKEYRLDGELWRIATALTPTPTNTSSTGTVIFTADSTGTCGALDMVFSPLNTTPYMGDTLGIKQYLYKNNGTSASPDWILIFVHNSDLSDPDERVTVKSISISTTANSERSVNNKELAAGRVKIKDSYAITGLVNGQSYTLEGTVKDASGNTVATQTDSISMVSPTGSTYNNIMTFEFDSTPYVGQTLYVHQTLKNSSGTILATHTGTAANGETVTVLTPELITSAASAADGSKELYAGTVDVKDTVTYRGLASGSTYTIKGELWKLKADGTRDFKVADATDSFTASSEDDLTTGRTLTFTNVDVLTKCAVNNKLTLPCKFVVFEYIYYGNNGNYFQKHEDVSDTQQIVSVKPPTLESDAYESQNYTFGAANNSKKFALGSVSPIDEITYGNLVIGQTYIIKSELVYEDGQPVKDKNGDDIVVRESFTATSTGKVVIDSFQKFDSVFDYDFSLGANQKKYVIYQTIYFGDTELVAHKDLTDSRQTLQLDMPVIHTDARYKNSYDGNTSKLLGVGDVTMIDYVDYEGLVGGEWYTLRGYIIDPETGDVVKINNEYIESSKTFQADANGAGTTTIEINVNTVSLQGRKFVVYEELYRSSRNGQNDDRLLAEHKEALDEGNQTIGVKTAKIETTASDLADDDNVLAHEDGQTIHDVVDYDGLLMGEQYTLYGYLWDKTNNRPLLDADGKRIEAYATFTTPNRLDHGQVEMDFPIDAYNLPGVEIVVFEYLFTGDKASVPLGTDGHPDTEQVVTDHANPNSPSQTIKVSMRVGTEAVDVYDNDHIIGVGNVTVIDNLAYEGVARGQTYKAKGWIVNKATGEAITGLVSESAPFTIGPDDETSGSVPITFEFDTRELIGQELVVYEELYLVNGDTEELIAEHKDLDDSDQTVAVATPKIHTTASDRADGDKELLNNADVIILDKVEYEGLVKGTTYTLRGQLVDKTSGNRISGGITEVTLTFTPTRDAGFEEMEFAINTAGLSGKELVVFETLYIAPEATPDEPDDGDDEDGEDDDDEEETPETDLGFPIAEHKDLEDTDQTVRVKLDRPNTGLFTRGHEGAAGTGIAAGVITVIISGACLYFRTRKRKLRGTISFE